MLRVRSRGALRAWGHHHVARLCAPCLARDDFVGFGSFVPSRTPVEGFAVRCAGHGPLLAGRAALAGPPAGEAFVRGSGAGGQGGEQPWQKAAGPSGGTFLTKDPQNSQERIFRCRGSRVPSGQAASTP